MANNQEPNLTVGRNMKIGLFHLGSGMADVLTTGVWNRIMISDLGFAATPVGILVSLRYFLAPLGVWAGRVSDQRTVMGTRRLFWVWLGRAMMVLSTLGLGGLTALLVDGQPATALVWAGLVVALLLFSLGSAISGSTFLALIYDRAGETQRGRAVGVVWTFLLLGFTIGGVFFGLLLPSDSLTFMDYAMVPAALGQPIEPPGFTADGLLTLFIVAAAVMGALWFVSIWREERHARRIDNTPGKAPETSMMQDLGLAWRSRPMRFFMFYLSLSMIFAFSQDLVLEPFAADIFGTSAADTTRFSAYWGGASILGTVMFLGMSRRYRFLTNTVMSYIGVIVLFFTFILFAYAAFGHAEAVIIPALILLGLGLGFWNVGTLGLMMDMSPASRAGTFLGFWTLVVTLSRGLGVSGGGIMRDVVLQLSGDLTLSYGMVFVIGTVGLGVSLWTLSQVNVLAFRDDIAQPADAETVFVGAMD